MHLTTKINAKTDRPESGNEQIHNQSWNPKYSSVSVFGKTNRKKINNVEPEKTNNQVELISTY